MRRTGRIIQDDGPSSKWLAILPEGRKDITILGVFSLDGETTHSPNDYNWDVVDRLIKIEFGLDEVEGYAVYEYEDGSPFVTDDGVNISVANSNSCAEGTTPPGVTTVNVLEEVDVNIADASVDVVMIDYKAEAPFGPIEAGRIILIRKGAVVTVDVERFHQDELLPISFSASVLSDGMYLTITPDAGTSAVFSYITKKL